VRRAPRVSVPGSWLFANQQEGGSKKKKRRGVGLGDCCSHLRLELARGGRKRGRKKGGGCVQDCSIQLLRKGKKRRGEEGVRGGVLRGCLLPSLLAARRTGRALGEKRRRKKGKEREKRAVLCPSFSHDPGTGGLARGKEEVGRKKEEERSVFHLLSPIPPFFTFPPFGKEG